MNTGISTITRYCLFAALALCLLSGCSRAAEYQDKGGVYALLQTTLGTIVLKLDEQRAPISTMNFIRYAEDGYYDGTIFHRVISNFMIQGGGFTREVTQKTEGLRSPIKNEWQNGLKNKRGTIAMARTQAPDSATSQFFINVVDNSFLDIPRGGAAYAVFGEVVEGMDVVDEIRGVKCIVHPNYPAGQAVTPEKPVVIKEIVITGDFDRRAITQKIDEAKARERAPIERDFAAAAALVEKETGKTVQKTGTGLGYVMVKAGSGPRPDGPADVVEVHYEGKLVDGTVFDSSYQRGETTTFPLNQVIRGWTEGVGDMKVGEKRVLVIPPELGYGSRGAQGLIPPNAVLIFIVELVSLP